MRPLISTLDIIDFLRLLVNQTVEVGWALHMATQ
jgi:hypothetical protein